MSMDTSNNWAVTGEIPVIDLIELFNVCADISDKRKDELEKDAKGR